MKSILNYIGKHTLEVDVDALRADWDEFQERGWHKEFVANDVESIIAHYAVQALDRCGQKDPVLFASIWKSAKQNILKCYPNLFIGLAFPDFQFNPEHEQPEWLVDGLIPKGSIGMLYGESGSYKSFLCTTISRAIAGGINAVGKKVQKGKVLYLCGEGANGVNMRLTDVGEEVYRVGRNIKFHNHQANIKGVIDAIKPDLIIYDTLNSLGFDINNNSSADVAELFHTIKGLSGTASHLIVHHATKAGDSMEGSHVFKSNADFVLRTELVEDGAITITNEKQKDAIRSKPIEAEIVIPSYASDERPPMLVAKSHAASWNESLSLRDRHLLRVDLGNERLVSILDWAIGHPGGFSRADVLGLPESEGVSVRTVSRDLAKLIETGYLKSDGNETRPTYRVDTKKLKEKSFEINDVRQGIPGAVEW